MRRLSALLTQARFHCRARRLVAPFVLSLCAACAKSDAEWSAELGDADPFVRALAAIALSEQAPERSGQAVVVLLETVDQVELRLRRDAEVALARIAYANVEPLLASLLRDEFMTADRRQAALDALRAAGPRALPALIGALRGPLRERAAGLGFVLVELGEPAVAALGELVAGDDPWLCGYAAFVLGEIGPRARAALPALRAACAHPDPAVANEARQSIARIEAEPSAPTMDRERAPPAPAQGRERVPDAR